VLLLTRNIIFSKKSLYNPDIKQNIITIKCTALTFLEIFSFSSCGGSVIQKFTFVWINSKIWDYTQANFVLGALKLVVVCLGCEHAILQAQTCSKPIQLVAGYSHLLGFWICSPLWDGLRIWLICTHFQQILNQSQMKFLWSILVSQDHRIPC
jgi:hypothetical protein